MFFFRPKHILFAFLLRMWCQKSQIFIIDPSTHESIQHKEIRRTAFTLSYGFLHICLPTIYNSRKASFHAIFQIWCQTGVRFLSTNARTPNFTGLFSLTTSSSGKLKHQIHMSAYPSTTGFLVISPSIYTSIILHIFSHDGTKMVQNWYKTLYDQSCQYSLTSPSALS